MGDSRDIGIDTKEKSHEARLYSCMGLFFADSDSKGDR